MWNNIRPTKHLGSSNVQLIGNHTPQRAEKAGQDQLISVEECVRPNQQYSYGNIYCLALELYMLPTATDTLNQLGSTSPELLGSDEDYYHTLNYAPELGFTLYILWQVSRL
jgi:hypothetical protein